MFQVTGYIKWHVDNHILKTETYTLINTVDQFNAVFSQLTQSNSLAIDVEFDNKYSYETKICLVQISNGRQTYLFDSLTVDITPLQAIFENPNIIKLFFSGIQDIQLLQTRFDWQIRSIVDISTIYQVISNDPNQSSLNDVVEDILGVEIPKNKRIQSREDWKQRPLPEEMQLYAARDVMYLHRTLVKMQKQLQPIQQKLLEVYFLQIPLISEMRENTLMYAFQLIDQYRIRDELEQYLLYRLVELRESIARKEDKSSGYIISKSNLRDLISRKPTSVFDLKQAGIFHGGIKKYFEEILSITKHAVSQNQSAIESSEKYLELKKKYEDFYPYYRHLDESYNWPYAIEPATYRNRRGVLRIVHDMLEDKIGDNLQYLFTRYLVHQLAVNEEIRLDQIRYGLFDCNTLEDYITLIYDLVEQIYEL